MASEDELSEFISDFFFLLFNPTSFETLFLVEEFSVINFLGGKIVFLESVILF